jgi:hypothetical protein
MINVKKPGPYHTKQAKTKELNNQPKLKNMFITCDRNSAVLCYAAWLICPSKD